MKMKKMKCVKTLGFAMGCSLLFVCRTLSAGVLDVIISEVMYNPLPSSGLPGVEYVELYNASAGEVSLSGWKLAVGKSLKNLPGLRLPAASYLLLAAASDTAALSPYGRVAALSSLSLNNTSQSLSLLDAEGRVVFGFTYRHEWQDDTRQTGGWSLEMADLAHPCEEEGNWVSSVSACGGTPGQPNSVQRTLVPQPLALSRVVNEDSVHIRVFFSQKAHPEAAKELSAYVLEGIGAEAVVEVLPDWKSVRLRLREGMRYGEVYRLRLAAPLCGCAGGEADGQAVRFARAEAVDSLDLVINELLTHPYAGGSPFVELYNRSDKVLDLKYLRLSSLKSDGHLDTGKRVAADGWQLFPGAYVFLCKRVEAVTRFYAAPSEAGIAMDAFPSYAQGAGRVILLDKARVVDDLSYDAAMHYPLLVSTEGVSLERVHPDVSTPAASHWHSASSQCGYATPGLRNSCFSEGGFSGVEVLQLENGVFSPDGDGYADVLKVRYVLPEAGYRGNVCIYRADGLPVCQLVRQELLGAEGLWVWDGLSDSGQRVPLGAYLLVFEYWNLKGELHRVRRAVTVATRW